MNKGFQFEVNVYSANKVDTHLFFEILREHTTK